MELTPQVLCWALAGTIKGITSHQLQDEALDCKIILGNTYHLGLSPGGKLLDKVGGLHKFMNWWVAGACISSHTSAD